MEKLKDFFYNKNDILVAVLILVLAMGIIYMKVINLMEYPEKLVKMQAAHSTQDKDDL